MYTVNLTGYPLMSE